MPDPIHKGSLREISFAKAYYAVAGQGRTGVMDIVDEADDLIRKQLFFLGGDSNFVKFGPVHESLGQLLVQRGLLTEDRLEEAVDEIALSHKQLGQVLVEKGWVSREKLHEFLIYQTEYKLINCFAYTEGRFRFVEESVSKFNYDVPMHKMIPEWVVYQGVKKYYSIDRLEKEFEFLKEKGLKLSKEFEKKKNRIRFVPEELKFVNGIGTGRPFGQIIGTSKLGLTVSLKVLYAMLVVGMVEVAEVKSLKNVKVEEKPGIRRPPQTVDLSDAALDELAAKMPAPPPSAPKKKDDFADLVGDYLTEKMQGEQQAAQSTGKGDLVKYAEHSLDAPLVSELLIKHKKDAIQSLLATRGSEGAARIGEILVQNKVIGAGELQEAYTRMREEGTSFLNSLIEAGSIKDEDVHMFLSEHFKVPAIKLTEIDLDQDVVSTLPEDLSMKYRAIPINRTGATLVVAMADPSNIEAIDEIKFLTGLNIDVVVATEHDIKEAIDRYHDSADMLDDVMNDFDDSDIETATFEDDFDLASASSESESAPVVKLVNQILLDALAKKASDIHFEPYETAFRVRYRIDGVLYHIFSPPIKLKNALVSRVKILSKLNIAERRLPQDGRISLKMKGKKIDFRVSTLPTLWGEKMVLRILDKESLQLDLTKLGMLQPQLDDFRWSFHQPYGMVLVTGPSGSGKTTTLYSALIEMNQKTDNVSTAEDPIEYYLEGINQVQMHDEVGLNFAYTLRSFLRQDPDIIMVGEIRDFETAEIAVKAALTGHVVLSTVHTNDAPSTINRLLNMGVEPFLITASVNGVLSQRLVRKLCDKCKEPAEFDPKFLASVGVPENEVEDFVAYKPVGCNDCSDRGYKGRIGVYEVMTVKGDIAEFILAGATPTELKREAMRRGMITMRQAGLMKAREGVTTVEEITRSTMPDNLSAGSSSDDD